MLVAALRPWLDDVVVNELGAGLNHCSQDDGKSCENPAPLFNFFFNIVL